MFGNSLDGTIMVNSLLIGKQTVILDPEHTIRSTKYRAAEGGREKLSYSLLKPCVFHFLVLFFHVTGENTEEEGRRGRVCRNGSRAENERESRPVT